MIRIGRNPGGGPESPQVTQWLRHSNSLHIITMMQTDYVPGGVYSVIFCGRGGSITSKALCKALHVKPTAAFGWLNQQLHLYAPRCTRWVNNGFVLSESKPISVGIIINIIRMKKMIFASSSFIKHLKNKQTNKNQTGPWNYSTTVPLWYRGVHKPATTNPWKTITNTRSLMASLEKRTWQERS